VRVSPVLSGLTTYPFVRLREAREAAEAAGADIIDFGAGEPREPTPGLIRDALVEAVASELVSTYPLAEGLPETRAAIAAWIGRRFGSELDAEREIVPTLGTKEVIFALSQVVGGPGSLVAVPTPGYPVALRGAAFAGAEVIAAPLGAAGDWLPDLDALPLDRIALLWTNYPNNPTAARAPLAWIERAAELARAHDFVLVCDEAYSELWLDGEPPASGLQLGDRRNVLVLNTLSKRSSVPGYRSGFAAGDAELIAAIKRYRPNSGTAPQAFVQRAAIAAWGDEQHVEQVRARYRAKRDVLLPALLAQGLRSAGGDATFFLWMRTPVADDEAFATWLLEKHGIVVAPGSFLGAGGEGHVRVALVPTIERCAEAAARLSG
jgi:aspartate/methionine/tyrosine aminotransferase